jgi:hypothetical protein
MCNWARVEVVCVINNGSHWCFLLANNKDEDVLFGKEMDQVLQSTTGACSP